MNGTPQDQQDRPSWKQPQFVLSAVVVLALLIAGVTIAVIGSGGDDSTSSTPTATSTPTAGSTGSTSSTPDAVSTQVDAEASRCGLVAADTQVPVSAPPADWNLVGGTAVPTSAKVGPGQNEHGLATCFVRSPTGALFAAAHFLAATGDPQLKEAAAQYRTAAGAGRDNAMNQVGQQSSPDAQVAIVGFTLLSATQDNVVVDLAMRPAATSGLAHVPLTLQWQNGDWLVVLPATGGLYPGLGALPDLTGYTPWGAT